MPEPITLAPRDIEVEYTQSGPIIHIFPEEKDPYQVIENLLQGIYLMHDADKTNDKVLESRAYAATFLNKIRHK